jgi:hypothetical protein
MVYRAQTLCQVVLNQSNLMQMVHSDRDKTCYKQKEKRYFKHLQNLKYLGARTGK